MILQIAREPLKPDCEAAYSEIEEDTARNSVKLNCPHPYLALELLTGPKEIWWLNVFDSEEHRQQVAAEYAKNRELMQVLECNSKRKASLTEPLIYIYATLSEGSKWSPAGARFLAIGITTRDLQTDGSVFQMSDDHRCIIIKARTRAQAVAAAKLLGTEAKVFAIRPKWSFPAQEWTDTDSEFWNQK